jgi:large subunit ribosomal protein L10
MTNFQPRVIRPGKAESVEAITKKFSAAKSIFLTDYSGLTVEAITQLRRDLRKSKVEYLVVKNTLARISARNAGYEAIVPHLDGPTAVALGMDDPVAPARVIANFVKGDRDKPKIKACLLEGQLYEGAQAIELAKLPSRNELIAKLLGSMNAPLSGMAQVLSGVLRNFVYALNAVAEKKKEENPPAPSE